VKVGSIGFPFDGGADAPDLRSRVCATDVRVRIERSGAGAVVFADFLAVAGEEFGQLALRHVRRAA